MQDQLSEILYFAKGIVRNKWIVTIIASIICIGGWVYVYKMPNIYQSSARVHVDTRTMLRPLLRGMAVQTNVRGLVLIMQKLMFTQQNILKVAEEAGLDVDLNESGIHALVQRLKSKVKIEGGRDEIFSITSESKSPLEARTIVQAMLTVFSEQTQQSSLSDVDSAQRFIENQIREYEQRLRNAERAKENFKRDNIGMLPGQGGKGQIGGIQAIRQNLESASAQKIELHSRKSVLKEQLEEALDSGEEWGLTEIVGSESDEDPRIASLKQKKDQLLLKYTQEHPSIVSIENLIETLEKESESESDQEINSMDFALDDSFKAMSNPYVQSIKIGINAIDVEIATINSRITSFKNKLQKEDEQFNTRLVIETEMQDLNRDYATIKKNYMSLLDRREQASMSSKIDTQVSALKFKVIDPANMPEGPSSPNRKLFYSIILLAGFIVGIVIALLKVFLRPTFGEAKQVRDVSGLPMLGVVSEVVDDIQAKSNKKRLFRFALANILLLLGYSGVMLLDTLA